MKDILNKLYNHERLSKTEAKEILINIAAEKYNDAHLASFMTVFMMRPITADELAGFRNALNELAIKVDFSEYNTIDIVGTGGDGKDTFNISTLSSFVVAGSGVRVTKHGNYGVSSVCGSSNVLQHLGLQFTNDVSVLTRQLEEAGICYLHAPLFHPAMRHVGAIRRGLGVKTFFNMLGPLLNPARPNHQLTGVFSTQLLPLYKAVFEDMGINYAAVHSLDVYDEISLTSFVHCLSEKGMKQLKVTDFNLSPIEQSNISGGADVVSSARIFMDVLEGKGSQSQNEVIFANAGMAIAVARKMNLLEGIERAKESLVSGAAMKSFKTFIDNQ